MFNRLLGPPHYIFNDVLCIIERVYGNLGKYISGRYKRVTDPDPYF